MESSESRFAHLLQPIRELTKNWDIDVASELNDYLEELDEMCITFDGGKIKLNFAEAALLIQGSACIYSKKVELLYSLVYQTMEYINNKNKKQDKQKGASDKGDANGSSTNDDDDDCTMFKPLQTTISVKSQDIDSTTCVHMVPLPPEALTLPETHEKQKRPLIGLKGEVLGSHMDFRINVFVPGDQDFIFLGTASSELSVGMCDGDAPDAPEAHVTHVDQGGDDDEGDGFVPLQDEGVEMDHMPEEHIERHQQTPGECRVLRERRDLQLAETELDAQRSGKDKRANTWQLHNIYDAFGEDQPLKTGKCYKVPDGLDDAGKRKRKRPSSRQDFRSWFTGIFDPIEHKLKCGPKFTDLNYIYLSKVKEKIKSRRRIFRKAGVVVSDEDLRRTFLQPEVGQRGEEDHLQEANGHPELQGGDEEYSDNEHEPEFGGGQDFVLPGTQGEQLGYEDLVRKSVEEFLVNSQGYAQETELSRRVKDWEGKIRPVLEMQEERPTFDIHDYGDRIVEALSTVGHRRSFASIVHGLDNFEACKYMLASLQLANDYTVEIDCEDGLEEVVDTMTLMLLSTNRANERFETLGTF